MNRLAYLLSLICILAFSSCEEDKVYYHTAANIIRKSKFPPNPERSVQFSGKRTKRSVQKIGCTQHL